MQAPGRTLDLVPIAPVTRTAVSDAVFAALTEEVLSGRLAPDEALPSERELAEAFEVNRHAVREALKRLREQLAAQTAAKAATPAAE